MFYRESEGKCIGYLSVKEQKEDLKSASVWVTFSFDENRKKYAINFAENDFVIIGTFKSPCFGYAYIENITENSITVLLDRYCEFYNICSI